MTAADTLFSLLCTGICCSVHTCVCVQPYHDITIVVLEVMMQAPSQFCIIHTQ